MLKPIINPPESEPILVDKVLECSSDKKTMEVVTRSKDTFPPLHAFDVDVLMTAGVTPSTKIGSFISASPENVADTLDTISENISANEIQEF